MSIDPFNGKPTIKKLTESDKQSLLKDRDFLDKLYSVLNIPIGGGTSVAPSGSSGVSIGDTIGNSPTANGLLYSDGGVVANDLITIQEDSFFGGLVTAKSFTAPAYSGFPTIGWVDATGFGQPGAVGVLTPGADAQFYFMIDTTTLSAKAAINYDPGTPANSYFAVAMANGLSGTPELYLTTSAADLYVPLDMNSNPITAVDDPTNAQDVATKNYVDGLSYLDIDDILPSQSGNSGEFLTTNGTTASWATVSASPAGSDNELQYNNSGAFGAMSNVLQDGAGVTLTSVDKTSCIAIGPQGDYGSSYSVNEPHLAVNTVRIIGNGGQGMLLKSQTGANNVYLFVASIAAGNYVTPSNGIIGLYLTENGANNAATITMGPTDQGFFARKARLQAQCETGLIAVDATINTIQAKGQTSQTGDLYSGADASANIVFRVGQDGGAVFNENSTSTGDVRMEGDTDANLFYSDASADSVQIGSATTADSAKFYVNGKISTSGEMEINGDLNHDGSNIGFFGVAPTTRQTELTDELTTVTFTAPGTPDYAIQDLTLAGYGFVTADEGNTVLSVIANLQTRVNELETKLTAYGLLQDAD